MTVARFGGRGHKKKNARTWPTRVGTASATVWRRVRASTPTSGAVRCVCVRACVRARVRCVCVRVCVRACVSLRVFALCARCASGVRGGDGCEGCAGRGAAGGGQGEGAVRRESTGAPLIAVCALRRSLCCVTRASFSASTPCATTVSVPFPRPAIGRRSVGGSATDAPRVAPCVCRCARRACVRGHTRRGRASGDGGYRGYQRSGLPQLLVAPLQGA